MAELREKAKKRWGEIKGRASKAYEEAKERDGEAKERLKQRVEDARERLEESRQPKPAQGKNKRACDRKPRRCCLSGAAIAGFYPQCSLESNVRPSHAGGYALRASINQSALNCWSLSLADVLPQINIRSTTATSAGMGQGP